MTEPEHRAGQVALVGRPNVGKSTLLNRLVGQKISITSRKAQTTRYCVTGIVTTPGAQIVFVDTPGYQLEHASGLNRAMNRSVARIVQGVDVVLWVVEAPKLSERDTRLHSLLPRERPLVVAVNKVDRVREKTALLPLLRDIDESFKPAAIVPICATRGTAVDRLITVLVPLLPRGPRCYEEDEITTVNERDLAAELIREQLFRLFGEELPYACAVEIETFHTSEKGARTIRAGILVAKESQKPIVIGHGGEKLKEVATRARRGMETLFGGRVHLDVWVKTRPGWAEDAGVLRRLGLAVD